jgi:uncharacterized repeat protein (TIGR01451 family)
LSAIVITDHQAYAPGACVNITGSGFGSRETVDLQAVNEATGVAYPSWKATGGTNGKFATTWTMPSDAVGDTLQLSATGEASESTAQAAFSGGATISTDRRDYPPGSAANISGVGWQPDETVSLEVFNETTKTDQTDWTVTADSRGDVSTTLTIGNWVGDTLRLTATGVISGLTAQNTFTDSLAVSATISPTTAVVGQPQTYTFTLSVNNGSDSAFSATVAVPSISNDPSDITITSDPGGWSAALNTSTTPHEIDLTGTTPVKHNGTDLAFTFNATATTAGTATWTTTAYNGSNQTGSSDQPSPQPRVTVIGQSGPTLTTTPNPASVTLSTTRPTLKDSATLSGGSSPTGSITFTLFHVGGTTPVDTETVTVNGNGTYTTPTGFTLPITGTVTGTYQWDASYSGDSSNNPASDNNAANEQVTVAAASPAISTAPNPSTGVFGTTLQDTATLTGGFHPTGSITFRLYAPGVDPTVGPATYTENVTGINSNGTYHTTAGFAANATGTWHWVATYNGDSNNSSVSAGPLAEPVTIPPQADLALTKTVNNPAPNVGDTVAYTVTLSNLGPDAATNAQVTDLLPSGLSFISATPSVGTYNSSTGLWTVGTVTTSTVQTLVVQATVVSPSTQTNTATISHSDQFDPDTGNNTTSATETPQLAELALTKTVSNPTPNVGDTISFTVGLRNNGPDTATNVQVTDLLPAGLTFVSATPSEGSYDSTTGVWTVGTVTVAGGIQTLVIQATVISPSAQTNSATITHSDQFDPNPGDNTATATQTPQQADLVLAKSVNNPTPKVGETITYTITLGDNGPDSATNVQVTDLLPAGVTFVSAIPSQGTYDPVSGLWTVGTVDTLAPRRLVINAGGLRSLDDQHGDDHPLRPVRPQPGQQHGDDGDGPATGGPLRNQDRQRLHRQRGRYDRLHGHGGGQRPGQRHRGGAPGPLAGGAHPRHVAARPGDV